MMVGYKTGIVTMLKFPMTKTSYLNMIFQYIYDTQDLRNVVDLAAIYK